MGAMQLALDLVYEVPLPPRAQQTKDILNLRQGLETRRLSLRRAEEAVDGILDVPQRQSWGGLTLEGWRKRIGLLNAEIAGIRCQLAGYGEKVEVG